MIKAGNIKNSRTQRLNIKPLFLKTQPPIPFRSKSGHSVRGEIIFKTTPSLPFKKEREISGYNNDKFPFPLLACKILFCFFYIALKNILKHFRKFARDNDFFFQTKNYSKIL